MVPDNRPSLRAAAQRGIESNQPKATQPKVAGPAAQPPKRAPGERPPPPPIVAYEDVVAACGHPEKFGLFADRLDKFRKDRRKKLIERPCRACREKKALEEQEALKLRQEEKQKRAEEAAQAPRVPKKHPTHTAGRLPDGSKFEVTFDGSKTLWTGSLTIGETVFSGSAGALFTLLNRLDRQYRQSLPNAPTDPPTEEKS